MSITALHTLIQGGDIAPENLKSPKHEPGRDCYIYIPGHTSSDPNYEIVAYERTDLNFGEGVNVLFMDGHVEFKKLRSHWLVDTGEPNMNYNNFDQILWLLNGEMGGYG